NTGEILAMASHPPFDANKLSRGITNTEWDALSNDPGHPLTNRAIQGQYPPGSVFKIIAAAAALETKEITPSFTFFCRGGYPFGSRIYREWKGGGHGWMDLHQAVVQSCDVYFYEAGRRIGVDRLAEYAARFGLGQETGIELLSEKKGLMPSSAWKQSAKGEVW